MKIINKIEALGQYFTKPEIVVKVLDLLLDYKKYSQNITILEPSSGTGNFIKVLKERKFSNIRDCEIDPELTRKPCDFFELNLRYKYDLIIGNPPFSKYNLPESYYSVKKYEDSKIRPSEYLPLKRPEKIKIENTFIYKSIQHLKDEDSTIGFVLPISFFIKNKNKDVKNELLKSFQTVIIYQNSQIWFDRNIPCCFTIFTNIPKYQDKALLLYENGDQFIEVLPLKESIHEELIPQVRAFKRQQIANLGKPLSTFLSREPVKVRKSYSENTVSASDILEKTTIPSGEVTIDCKLAVARVGNASVGRCGLINIKKDILNDMFYVFEFADKYKGNKKIKEAVCEQINANQKYFRNITCRVGSKSIKKEDIYGFRLRPLQVA